MLFSITTALALAIVRPTLASPGVLPARVSQRADAGSSFDISKVVTTPEIPPRPDVVLLVDVTGSMGNAISNIKTNLANVIATVKDGQPTAQFAVASFGDLNDPNGFQVNQGLTDSVSALQTAVNSLRAEGGQDTDEDWINALYRLSTGSVAFRAGSSRIIVVVGDAPSHDPSGGHSLASTIAALTEQNVRVIGVDVSSLNGKNQATAVTSATGGIIIGSAADEVSAAIVSGLKNLNVTVVPDVVSCDAGVSLAFNPASITVGSGGAVTFRETASVGDGAAPGAALNCSVRFLLNGSPGGDAFVQGVTARVNPLGCYTCNPNPGENKCHITTACASTPFGNMCLTRPGFKADGAADDNVRLQWRLVWAAAGGQEHRVAVKPGTSSNTLCDSNNRGDSVCKEVVIGGCLTVASNGGARFGDGVADQAVMMMGGGEL
ncbi:hypothetical protein B0T25DRAFT_609227 [Lasiosphaeria hispida]|uniref:VWFA domain-containing protein n=1 Tax=Lasiosphaeria hispida TaxID=260671 RepID=A0AAJ0HDL5_9PEZI|nr:hypothetical protein B0T25DRAFT_609227 [Lasiosphaeria hispida]